MLLVTIPALAATASTAEVVATLVLDPAQLEFGQHEGYDLVTIDGAVHTTEPARPMLPVFYVQLLLPPGSDCSDITASHVGTVGLPGPYDILPAPRPVTFTSEQEAEVPQPNARTYHTERPYPAEIVRLAGVGSLGGHRIATVRVAPLQYVPVTGELVLHTNIEISVATEVADGEGARLMLESAPTPAAADAVRKMVVNADELPDGNSRMRTDSRSGADLDYMIICPDALVDAFQPLADWKTLKGVRAAVVTLEDIAADPLYVGVDEAERIRECIKDYRSSRGISWVLLGGDTSLVPARMAHDFFYDQGIPSDLYYADLDGTWNADGDTNWGEIDEDDIDMYSDVFVGRAPVNDAADATAFVDKVLAYEGAPFEVRDDFQLDMLFLGEIMWDSPDPYTDGGVALDMIEDGSVPPRFAPITKLYQRNYNLFSANAVVHLNGGYNIVVHEGHANIGKACTGPDDMTIEQMDGLTNGDGGGLWYSVGCWSAAIDHDTFGEHWLTNPNGGGVAYVGNARYGWGCPGYPGQCVSDLYSQEFFESLFVRDLVHAGVVHADAKHQFVGMAASDDYMRYAMYELNLLGDPETPIWTAAPRSLNVSHADAVEVCEGTATLSVSVLDSGAPLEGARVCVASSDLSVYEVAETGASGIAVVTFEDSGATDVTVTVSAANCVPHGSSVAVEGSETGVDDEPGSARVTALRQNYPNPFNPATSIAFSLKEKSPVTIAVYDVAGRRVALLVDDEFEAGVSSVRWDGRDASGRAVASGTYFARMVAGGELFETKMTLLK